MDFNDQLYNLITTGWHKAFSADAYAAPDIPERKLNGAIKKVTRNLVSPKQVLFINDQTVFGSASDGIVLTLDEIFYAFAVTKTYFHYELAEIKKVSVVLNQKGKKLLQIVGSDDRKFEFNDDMFGLNVEACKEWLEEIVKLAKAKKSAIAMGTEEEQEKIESQSLEQMPLEIKVGYIKIILIFLVLINKKFDAQALSCFYNLVSRINLDAKTRFELYKYMADTVSKQNSDKFFNLAKDLIKEVSSLLDTRARQEILFSLFKDMIFMQQECHKEEDAKASYFIQNLAQSYNISEDKLSCIKAVIHNDRLIFDDNIDDKGLNEGFSKVAAMAASVGVPLAALYFSGSVIGLSAAGITSGLATLGLGGLFGLSGMVTGIGAVVLIGLGAHKGVKYLTGANEIENRKRKEALLLKVNQGLQRTLQVIMEDVNLISNELNSVLVKQREYEKDRVNLEDKLKYLSDILILMTQTGALTSSQSELVLTKAVRQRLPLFIDVTRLEHLTEEPTKKEAFALVMEFYKKTHNTEGEVVYRLRDDLSLDEAEDLAKLLEMLDYFSVTSVAVSSIKNLTKGWL